MVGEDGRYQRDAFIGGKGVADQPFPGWRLPTRKHGETNERMVGGMNGQLTE